MMRRTQKVLTGGAAVAILLLPLFAALGQTKDEGAKVTSTAKEESQSEQPPEEEKATHDALIALRDRILKRYDAKDIGGVLAELDESVVVTMQDGVVCRGPKAVQDYYDEKVGRPDSIVKELKTVCLIDRWSRLYNDQSTAVVDGRLDQDFFLRDGKQFHLVSPWTATLVKRGDDWKVAAFHVSANMFDNGVLNLIVQQNRLWTGMGAGVAGVVVGVLLGALVWGRRHKASGASISA